MIKYRKTEEQTMKKIISLLLSVCLISACAPVTDFEPEQTTDRVWTVSPEKMTLEEKVGQMLFVRCVEPQYTKELMDINPGGILMFGRDFEGLTKEEVKEKIHSFQNDSDIPLIIGADEEGGTVVRVSSNPNLAPEKYSSPQDIYNSGGMEALISNTAEKSHLLRDIGITMNLAPVADVPQNEDDFIYDRSMGTDAEETAECVKSIVSEMKSQGIYSCLKHFPGYGGNSDTHTTASTDSRGADSFRQITQNPDGTKSGGDLIPFIAGIEAGVDSVLVSHNTVSAFDSENPASLSPAIHELLRGELGFEGVIMTDDIAMGAVADLENVYTRAVLAGNDLLITTDYKTGYNQILNAVKSGEIPEEIIDAAVERILRLKGLI